jgi:hypothetical protein
MLKHVGTMSGEQVFLMSGTPKLPIDFTTWPLMSLIREVIARQRENEIVYMRANLARAYGRPQRR